MEYNSIKITSAQGTFGTTIEVNGQVVKACRCVSYRHAVDGVPVLTLEILALGDVLIDGHATVEQVKVEPQFEIRDVQMVQVDRAYDDFLLRQVEAINEVMGGRDLREAA